MHTDADAQTKNCPVKSDSAGNVLCSGSSCMAWEWAKVGAPDGSRMGYCTALNQRPPAPPGRTK